MRNLTPVEAAILFIVGFGSYVIAIIGIALALIPSIFQHN